MRTLLSTAALYCHLIPYAYPSDSYRQEGDCMDVREKARPTDAERGRWKDERRRRDQELFALNEQIYRQIDPWIAERVALVTRSLYALAPDGTPSHVGSGVLLKMRGATFLLTAAHVIDEVAESANLGIAGNGQIVRAEGEARFTTLPNGARREDDRIDAAVLRLTDTCVTHLACPTLSDDELAIGAELAEGDPLLLAGFPAAPSMSSVDLEARFVSRKLLKIVARRSSDSRYAALRTDPATNVVVTFDYKRAITNNARVTSPALDGMSGGGVWMLSGARGKLAAIFTDHPRRTRTLISTHITEHLRLMEALLG
jgi:hypothetical protein